jgi:hypothetical protein
MASQGLALSRWFQRVTACLAPTPKGPTAQQVPHLTSKPTKATECDPQNGHGFSSGKSFMGTTFSYTFDS